MLNENLDSGRSRDSSRETSANLSITGHLRSFSDQPVAEIVQCDEPAFARLRQASAMHASQRQWLARAKNPIRGGVVLLHDVGDRRKVCDDWELAINGRTGRWIRGEAIRTGPDIPRTASTARGRRPRRIPADDRSDSV